MDLSPKQIVHRLDKYIIGQDDAKKAVAIALRNRYRRAQLDEDLRNEISPKNILMIGPTGVGKTELCRVLAGALFESENALANLGSDAIASQVEAKVDSYLAKLKIQEGSSTITFNEDNRIFFLGHFQVVVGAV